MRRIYLTLLGAVVAVLLVAGCGGHSGPPYKTVAKPPLAGLTAPSCGSGSNHSMGACLPHASASSAAKIVTPPGGFRCVDRSNNDPLYGVAAWRSVLAQGFQCAYFKVNEGTGFIDRTAATMARDARAAGLAVGGYDFQHVCSSTGANEARVFVAMEKADGLTGPRTLPGAADVEYPSGVSCNARAWESQWRSTATAGLGRATDTYTGAWYWNPTFGCYWPGGLSWISGYGVRYPYMPSCHSELDLWQYTSTPIDLSSVRLSAQAYAAFANLQQPGPPPKPKPKPVVDPYGYRYLWSVEAAVVARYDGARKHPVKYAGYLKHTLEPELAKLAGAIYAAAHRHKPPNWGHVVAGHGLGSRGVRYHMLIIRAHGQQVVR